MKINQLFTSKVDEDATLALMMCFGLTGFSDKRTFSKNDFISLNTVEKVCNLRSSLEKYYLPCKAKIYLGEVNDKRVVTILRQVLRLYGFYILSKEKNFQNRKVIFYSVISESERRRPIHMKLVHSSNVLTFD